MTKPDEEETFFQYCMRLSREARLRKDAVAKEAAENKQRSKEQRRQRRQRCKEQRRQIGPEPIAWADIRKQQLQEAAIATAAARREIEHRMEAKICICCGDDRDIKTSGHCQQCWNEIYHGIIEPPGVSERQVHSARCRVVRKGTEMS